MLEKIKSVLKEFVNSRQVCISGISIITAGIITLSTLLGNSIYTVNVFDGSNKYTVRTINNNVANAISKLNINCSYNIEKTTVTGKTTSVEISYDFPIYVTCGDKTVTLKFLGGTVKDALLQAGYNLDEYDMVYPSLETEIIETTYIDYTDIDYVNGSYTEKIPYTTSTVYSSQYNKGVTKTVQEGANGEKKVEYTEKLVNGVIEDKIVTASTVVKEAVQQKKIVGTKVEAANTGSSVKAISVLSPKNEIELDKNGNPVKYSKKMICRATAYTYTGNNCSTGVAPKPGYIAVNPKVIPYGTQLYIKSADGSIIYGYAVAADTGGFIRKHPTGIDLFLTSESACEAFGVRNMEVYFIG